MLQNRFLGESKNISLYDNQANNSNDVNRQMCCMLAKYSRRGLLRNERVRHILVAHPLKKKKIFGQKQNLPALIILIILYYLDYQLHSTFYAKFYFHYFFCIFFILLLAKIAYISTYRLTYHQSCFKCQRCHTALAGKPFVPIGK